MSDDDHEIRPRDHGEEIALFRFGVIGALTRRTLARGELRAEMRALSRQSFLPPGAVRTRTFSLPTLERWLYAHREGGLEALRPDHAVTVALRAIQRAAGHRATTEWLRLAVGAQSAHERGTLLEWYDRALATPRRADRPGVLRPVGSSPRAKAVDRP